MKKTLSSSPKSLTEPKSLGEIMRVVWNDAKSALMALSSVERGFHIFWLLGPFFLLIERSAADFWLSVIALAFVVRMIVQRQTEWLKHFWVRAVFVFWAVALVSAVVSVLPLYALEQAVIWIRFPLFAMAVTFWLARDPRLLHAMLLMTAIGLCIMCIILGAEMLLVGWHQGVRLTWPYGDLVPGGYLAKVGLPIFTAAVALAVSTRHRLGNLAGAFALLLAAFTLATGERINLLVQVCSGMLGGLVWKPKVLRYVGFAVLLFLVMLLVAKAIPGAQTRFADDFISQLPTSEESSYYRAMKPGVLAFLESPGLGVGTGNLRILCEDIIGDANLDCPNHPHNLYIQLAGETGIIGLITGVVMLWSIVVVCFRNGLQNRDNVIVATSFVIPFGVFWPIATSTDFFGQWHNIFIWSGIALALAAGNINKFSK